MLPFLQPKKMAGIIMAKAKPDGGVKDLHEEGEHDPGLMAASESLIRAVHSKDATAVASALSDAFEIAGSPQPESEEVEL